MFKIILNNCCGLDVHKTWIFACIGITDAHSRTRYYKARFNAFSNGLRDLAAWLAKYDCTEVYMESAGKYWIPVFNTFEKTCHVVLAHPKYTKSMKGNKTDRKDAMWICEHFMYGMVKPSFIPPPAIRQLRDLVRYRGKLTNMITGEKNRAQNCLTVSNLKLDDVFSDVFGKSARSITEFIWHIPERRSTLSLSSIAAAKRRSLKSRLLSTALSLTNRLSSSANALITSMSLISIALRSSLKSTASSPRSNLPST